MTLKPPSTRIITYTLNRLKENKFEAEYTYIDENKAGVGSSDNFSGLKLIFADNGTASSSNGYWVSGLYYNTAFIEFVITSDKAVTDAHLQLRLSAEWADMYLAPNNQSFGGKDYYGLKFLPRPLYLIQTAMLRKIRWDIPCLTHLKNLRLTTRRLQLRERFLLSRAWLIKDHSAIIP